MTWSRAFKESRSFESHATYSDAFRNDRRVWTLLTVVANAAMHVSAPVVIERGSIRAEGSGSVGAFSICPSYSCIHQDAERRVVHGHSADTRLRS